MQFGRSRSRKRWKLEETEEKKPEAAEAEATDAAREADEAGAADASGAADANEAADEAESAGEAGEASETGGETPVPPVQPNPAEPDWKDQYARLMADFDNFKKRTARDREDTYRFAEADILGDILPTVDNLALALEKAEDAENPFVKGVKLVYDSLLKSLKDHGAEPFDSVGKDLDTERMEAIAHLPSEDVEEGKVSIESKKGWMLKDKVLRAAQVVVSSGKPG